MRLLLDTHIAVAAVLDDPKLSARALKLIGEADNELVVSAVSLWEIAIKYSLRRGRKHEMPMPSAEALQFFREAGYSILDVTPAHAVAVEQLPRLHGDPFDRLLVAQALTEPLRLLTRDANLAAYSDTVIVV